MSIPTETVFVCTSQPATLQDIRLSVSITVRIESDVFGVEPLNRDDTKLNMFSDFQVPEVTLCLPGLNRRIP